MSLVSYTLFYSCSDRVPNPGHADIRSVRRDLATGTAANGPACTLPCSAREPVAATQSRPRANLPNRVRGRRRGHQSPADLRNSLAWSRSTARAPRRQRSNSPTCDARGWLRRGPHREHTGGLGSPYVAARIPPPGAVRPNAPKRLAQNRKASPHLPLPRIRVVEWVEE